MQHYNAFTDDVIIIIFKPGSCSGPGLLKLVSCGYVCVCPPPGS